MTHDPEMAFDRANRFIDKAGRLHVASSAISKAMVCPYRGSEIPGWRELGLDSERWYNLFRDPAELARAAESFNNIPVLSEHVPVTSLDHHPELVIGSTGTDGAWCEPYLKNSTVYWAQEYIDKIQTREQCELSAAYWYDADMTPGEYEGLHFDGIMRNIVGNHVALVKEGRAGPDVVVGDSAPMSKAAKVKAALMGTVSADVLERAVALAMDAMKEDVAEDEDDDKKDAVAEDEDDDKKDAVAEDEDDAPAKKPAMDKKPVRKAAAPVVALDAATIESNAVARVTALFEARDVVRPLVGDIKVAMDSAEDVYKFTLEAKGVKTAGVHPSAYRAMVGMLPSATATPATPRIAQDAAADAEYRKRFPIVPRK